MIEDESGKGREKAEAETEAEEERHRITTFCRWISRLAWERSRYETAVVRADILVVAGAGGSAAVRGCVGVLDRERRAARRTPGARHDAGAGAVDRLANAAIHQRHRECAEPAVATSPCSRAGSGEEASEF